MAKYVYLYDPSFRIFPFITPEKTQRFPISIDHQPEIILSKTDQADWLQHVKSVLKVQNLKKNVKFEDNLPQRKDPDEECIKMRSAVGLT